MLRRLKNKFVNIKLAKKMMLIYIGIALGLLLLSFAALQLCLHIFSEKLYDNAIKELAFYSENISETINDVQERSYELAMDEETQDILSRIAESEFSSMEYNQAISELRHQLARGFEPRSAIQTIRYTEAHGMTLEMGTSYWKIPAEEYEKAIEKFCENRGAFTTVGPVGENACLICGQEIRKYSDMSMKHLGTVLMVYDVSAAIKSYKQNLALPDSMLFVYSEDGMIYQDAEVEDFSILPEVKKGQNYKIVDYQGEKYFMCYLQSSSTGWMYVNMFPYKDIYGMLVTVQTLLIVFFLATFVLVYFAMNKVSHVITDPLGRLTESLQIVETGDFEKARLIPMAQDRKDEVGLLEREFRVMLEKIDDLLDENYQKQLLLQDTRYRMLQAQINPHFLYNTLSTLQWMARAGKNEESAKITVELGELLRASFAKSSYALATEEIQTVKSYIAIQEFRYRTRAEFQVKTYGDLSKYVVPRMLLQPLVENAIYYGVEKSIAPCRVEVIAREEEEHLVFIVKDTGPGIEAERLEQVRKFDVEQTGGHGIGTKNIYERLKIAYETFEFNIDSVVGEGTEITIRIPKVLQ